jgi:hypothetical protein
LLLTTQISRQDNVPMLGRCFTLHLHQLGRL